jgi:putative endonuclease
VPHVPTDDVTYYVYIVASRSRVLYTGVSNDLERRVFEHKNKLTPGFTSKYNVDRLVYFEDTGDVLAAIAREKQVKAWTRAKRVALIESINPDCRDLAPMSSRACEGSRDDMRHSVIPSLRGISGSTLRSLVVPPRDDIST